MIAWLLALALWTAFPQGFDSLAVYQVPGPDSVTLITLFSLPRQMLLFRQNSLPGTYQASVRYAVEIHDAQDRVVWSDFSENSWRAQNFEATQGQSPYRIQRAYRVPWSPRYRLTIRVEDLNSRNTLMTYHGQVQVHTGPPFVSDLIPLDPQRFQEGRKTLASTLQDTGRILVFVRWTQARGPVSLQWSLDGQPWAVHTGGASGWDTVSLRVDSLRFGTHELALVFHQSQEPSQVRRSLEFQVTGITHVPEQEFSHYLFILTHLFPGDTVLQRLKKAQTLAQRDSLWLAFWQEHDPTPGTPRNEFLDAFLDRVHYADAHFSVGRIRGSRTDRGLVYIRFGPPDEIEEHTLEWGTKDYQVWYYYDLKLRVVFVDEGGFGDYVLVSPTFAQLFQY